MDLNQCTFLGRIASDIQYSEATATSKSRAFFRLAVNRIFSAKGKERADFIPVVCWDVHADNLHKYCTKGKEVAVTGQLETNSERREDGTYNNYIAVRADSISYGRDSAKTQRERAEEDAPVNLDALAERLVAEAHKTAAPQTTVAELVLKLLEKGMSLEEAKTLATASLASKQAPPKAAATRAPAEARSSASNVEIDDPFASA